MGPRAVLVDLEPVNFVPLFFCVCLLLKLFSLYAVVFLAYTKICVVIWSGFEKKKKVWIVENQSIFEKEKVLTAVVKYLPGKKGPFSTFFFL